MPPKVDFPELLLEVAEGIGRGLNLPVASILPSEAEAHFSFLSAHVQADNPSSSTLTQDLLGWKPVHPGLIDDLAQGHYFEAPGTALRRARPPSPSVRSRASERPTIPCMTGCCAAARRRTTRTPGTRHERIDPELAEALKAVPMTEAGVFDLSDLEGTRAGVRAFAEAIAAQTLDEPSVSVEEVDVVRPDGCTLPIRLLRPTEAAGPLPVLLWFHGGGRSSGTRPRTIPPSSTWS
ncbi:hypothetical protein AB0L05_00805 [Nonomuraea pusilla]|uniref:hypothetical protein n=1 Tax=Nonomuraea pusilla TaxID=46177 RepID=UPI00332E5977